MSTLTHITNQLNPFKTLTTPRLAQKANAKIQQTLAQDTYHPTVKFGNGNTANTSPPQKSFWRDNFFGSRLNAVTQGAFKGFFNFEHWKLEAGLSALGFALTLPLAFIIPGSHFLLLPLFYLGMRGANSAWRATKGLINPNWVLKPKAAQTASQAGA